MTESQLTTARRKAKNVAYVLDEASKTVLFPERECVMVDLLRLVEVAAASMPPGPTAAFQLVNHNGAVAPFTVQYGQAPREQSGTLDFST